MKTLWVLTHQVNDYNQCGDYFVAAWRKKPTKDQLRTALHDLDSICPSDELVNHVYTTGGRQGTEDYWYTLRELKEGEIIDSAPL